jgi:hypothetical protein
MRVIHAGSWGLLLWLFQSGVLFLSVRDATDVHDSGYGVRNQQPRQQLGYLRKAVRLSACRVLNAGVTTRWVSISSSLITNNKRQITKSQEQTKNTPDSQAIYMIGVCVISVQPGSR